MKLSDFDYYLPVEQIAEHPVEPRDSAKLLIFDRENESKDEATFACLDEILQKGDVLVFNDSKVIPARIYGKVNDRDHEVLLVKKVGEMWECWVNKGRRLKADDDFVFSGNLSARFVKRENEIFYLKFSLKDEEFYKELDEIGEIPVPPYILKARNQEKNNIEIDNEDYQTVYAKNSGSAAAPTAGLHFTEELLERLEKKGVELEFVTLHVGLGTFQSVTTENVEDFQIHSEYYSVAEKTAENLLNAKRAGKRIIAVGTTSVRVLESFFSDGIEKIDIRELSGETNIYIYPGYKFKFVDGIITNFHLPKSSLLLLVSAFAGTENIKDLYSFAIKNKYRFYSYGDGMLLL